MALKLKISKTVFDTLPADVQAEYVADGADYRLDVTGLEDTAALHRAKQHEVAARKEAEASLREAQTRIAQLESGTDSRVSTLETANSELQGRYDADVKALRSNISTALLNQTSSEIANKISTSPALMLPHIKSRLSVEFDKDNNAAISVIGSDGKPAKTTLEELGQEFVANKDFSAIIKGNGSSGGASTRNHSGGAQSQQNQSPPAKNPANMTAKELAAYMAAKAENNGG